MGGGVGRRRADARGFRCDGEVFVSLLLGDAVDVDARRGYAPVGMEEDVAGFTPKSES